jgi:hypothetical protein
VTHAAKPPGLQSTQLLPTARPMDEVFGSDNGRRLCAAEF